MDLLIIVVVAKVALSLITVLLVEANKEQATAEENFKRLVRERVASKAKRKAERKAARTSEWYAEMHQLKASINTHGVDKGLKMFKDSSK